MSEVRLNQQEQLVEDSRLSDAMLCAIASEPVLGKEWNTPEEDVAWADL